MTLEEAIKYEEEFADEHDRLKQIKAVTLEECERAKEHRQIAEWLKELKQLREQTSWNPINEGLPKENKTVIASTLRSIYPEARYTKENGWEWAYESGAGYWKELEDVEAWMPLPKPYKPESEE